MPAKKTTKKVAKKTIRASRSRRPIEVRLSYQQLFVQSVMLAVVSAVATYSILKAGMLRDEVDAQLMQVLAQPTDIQQKAVEVDSARLAR
jgi:hypothetical protein